MLSLTVSKARTVIVGLGFNDEPFHPVFANPPRAMDTVAARAFGIRGTIGPSKGLGMMVSARNIERATARYRIFAIAIYYTRRSLITSSPHAKEGSAA